MGFDPTDGGSVFLTPINTYTPINDGVECLGRWSGLDLSAFCAKPNLEFGPVGKIKSTRVNTIRIKKNINDKSIVAFFLFVFSSSVFLTMLFVCFLSEIIPLLFTQVRHSLFCQEPFSDHSHPSVCHAFCETHVSVKKICENILTVKCGAYLIINTLIEGAKSHNFFVSQPISLEMV